MLAAQGTRFSGSQSTYELLHLFRELPQGEHAPDESESQVIYPSILGKLHLARQGVSNRCRKHGIRFSDLHHDTPVLACGLA